MTIFDACAGSDTNDDFVTFDDSGSILTRVTVLTRVLVPTRVAV